jgi:hypothetical protein
MFFFEKKNQKTFARWRTWPRSELAWVRRRKSFLVLFFKKEHFSSHLVGGCWLSGTTMLTPGTTGARSLSPWSAVEPGRKPSPVSG